MVDRSQRYKKSGKGAPDKNEVKAKTESEATAGGKNAPHAATSDKVGKVGEDKGPEGGDKAELGILARHKREHAETLKRHGEEHSAMLGRHAEELKGLHGRHAEEMVQELEKPVAEAEASAGTPPELGKPVAEGKGGSSA